MVFWNKKSSESPASEPARSNPIPAQTPSVAPASQTAVAAAQPQLQTITTASTASAASSQAIPTVRTVITKGTKIEGHLSFDAPVRIDGAVRGEILSSKQLVFGKHCVVQASVFASSVVVEGVLSGEVHVREALILKSGASLNGRVISPRLVVEEGAELNAQVWRSEEGLVSKRTPLAASIERTVDSAKGARALGTPSRAGHERIEVPASAAVH